MSPPLRDELRRLLALAWPAMATQLAMMLMGTVDTLIVGRYGAQTLAAVSLGNAWIYGVSVFAMGLVLGIDPIVSQAHGAGDVRRMGLALQRTLLLCVLLTIPVAALLLLTGPVLLATGQDPAIAREAHRFSAVQAPSMAFFLGFIALRAWMQGRGIVRPALVAVLLANLLNAVLCWALVFGRLGLPELGALGAGISTSIARAVMVLGLVAIVLRWRLHEGGWVPWSREALRWRGLRAPLVLGLPIGLQMGLEVGAFSVASLLAGRLGADAVAAHAVVLNLASLSFMLPLGVSHAAITRVGNEIGARRVEAAERAARVAVTLGAGVMAGFAALFLVARESLPRLYTSEPGVIALAAAILPAAAAFQIFDGTQVVAGGVLRGMGRTRPATLFHAVGWWVVALPLASWLVLQRGGGIESIWWSLCLGLALVAGGLLVYVRARGPRTLASVPLAAPAAFDPAGGL